MNALNNLLFIALPYVAIVIFLVGTIHRYRSSGFKYSSLSSQFLENRGGWYFLMMFHWGILVLFFAHLFIFLFPGATLAWNSNPVRLVALQVTLYMFGMSVLVGLSGLLVRRFRYPRLQVVTTRMDVTIEAMLITQIIFGLWIALGYRWGSSWFASDLSPYLWSIFKLNPQIEAISSMPAVIKAHVVGAFLIIGMVPFTRLVHFLVAPFHYILRPYQEVIWNWDPRKVRSASSEWSKHRPRNT